MKSTHVAQARPAKTKTYEAYDHKTGCLLPDYVETRAETEEGWLRLFYKCYPTVAKGVDLWNARIKPTGADVLDHRGFVHVTFTEVAEFMPAGQHQVR